VFIGALSSTSKGNFLIKFPNELQNVDCSFITIPSVLFEFTRGGGNLRDFNKRLKFITQDLKVTIYPIERYLDNLEDLIVVLQKIKPSAGYTDFLLSACLYKFSNAFLMTENHKDFPLEIMDRTHLVTFDMEKEIRNYGIYNLSAEKYTKAAKNILMEK